MSGEADKRTRADDQPDGDLPTDLLRLPGDGRTLLDVTLQGAMEDSLALTLTRVDPALLTGTDPAKDGDEALKARRNRRHGARGRITRTHRIGAHRSLPLAGVI